MSSPNLPSFRFFKLSAPAPYIIHVEINRVDKLNAFCPPMWWELKAIFEFLSPNPEVRCILLSGAGDRAFTAGMPCFCSLLPCDKSVPALILRHRTGCGERFNRGTIDGRTLYRPV